MLGFASALTLIGIMAYITPRVCNYPLDDKEVIIEGERYKITKGKTGGNYYIKPFKCDYE